MSTLDQSKTLNQLRTGERARIVEMVEEDSITIRLMEMGLIEGEEIELLGIAPLGDPMEFRVRGYRVSLRSDEARRLRVELLDPAN